MDNKKLRRGPLEAGLYFVQIGLATLGVGAVLGFAYVWLSSVAPLVGWHFSNDFGIAAMSSTSALVGCVLGYMINGRLRSKWAILVWILPLIWMYMLMHDFSTSGIDWQQVRIAFFSNGCQDSECVYELFGTYPVISSVGYSIGAWLGLHFWRRSKTPASI